MKERKSMIENSLNPLNKDADPDCLFNICTGKSCKKGTEDFLLNVESIGNEARKSFNKRMCRNPKRFEERIKKKKKIYGFATESGKRKIWGVKGKIIEAILIRDLFDLILCLSIQQEIDMAEVLKYLLTPVPLCLSHVCGSVNLTPKLNLLNYIDSQVDAAFFWTCN